MRRALIPGGSLLACPSQGVSMVQRYRARLFYYGGTGTLAREKNDCSHFQQKIYNVERFMNGMLRDNGRVEENEIYVLNDALCFFAPGTTNTFLVLCFIFMSPKNVRLFRECDIKKTGLVLQGLWGIQAIRTPRRRGWNRRNKDLMITKYWDRKARASEINKIGVELVV
ncbi:hypothetical protein RRG08_026085 [Elysia crispata]|uniref:Uncharacterized protein n=1 Tax=Elysia crispata TaxID=231223 RepID=A0AAE0YRM7_9GAST|nr:hypothetical protein RRG08_026085 [Elysia crispata]